MPGRDITSPEPEHALHYSVSSGPSPIKLSPSQLLFQLLLLRFFWVLVNKQISVGAFSQRTAVEVSILSLHDYLATCCSNKHLVIFHVFQQLSIFHSSSPSLEIGALSRTQKFIFWKILNFLDEDENEVVLSLHPAHEPPYNCRSAWPASGKLPWHIYCPSETHHSTHPQQRHAAHCCMQPGWHRTRTCPRLTGYFHDG